MKQVKKSVFQPSIESNAFFWQLQLGGWLLFTLINLAGRQYFVYFHFSELVNSVVLGFSLVISTSFLRRYYQQYLKSESLLASFGHITLGSVIASVLAMTLYALVIVPNQQAIFNSKVEILWQQIFMGLPMVMLLICAWSVCYAIVKKQKQLKSSKHQQIVLQESLKAARLDVLLSQINPHFIFNAINNIRALILEDTDKARDMLADLSEVMRYTMKIDKDRQITFASELEVAKQYIALNKLQFEGKLQVQYDIEPKSMSLSIPPMVLQLLVENAIKHGISKLKAGGKIIITSKCVESNWLLSVENSGILLPEKKRDVGVGVNNIKQRLQLVYGKESEFSLASSKLGVIAKVIIPLS